LDGLKELVCPWADSERAQIWIYSLISSALVGLSGIFPLLVIPLEAGEALRKGAAANGKLKLLLSFAVGGLLGDVFLHLLPEAWAHLDRLGGVHRGHIEIAVWTLTGLLTFMIIEKLFPEIDDNDNDDDDDKEQVDVRQTLKLDKSVTDAVVQRGINTLNVVNDCVRNGLKPCLLDINSTVTLDNHCHDHRNGLMHRGQPTVGTSKVVDGTANGLVRKTFDGDVTTRGQGRCPAHIKTSGWLNLMANMIDNFTHGLAVAGSFSVGIKTGLVTTFAILLHEIPHEIGDFAILLRAGFDRWKAAKAQLLTATGGILGAVAALSAESAQTAGDKTAWILPFTSGGFLYIALVTVLPDLLGDHISPTQSLKQFLLLCTGIAVMAMVTVFVD
jgi:zinc transporter 13